MKVAIESIYFYPIKSLEAIRIQKAEITTTGILYDREWMIVNEVGDFLTQREFPILNTIKISKFSSEGISLMYENKEHHFEWRKDQGDVMKVQVWNSECEGSIESEEISDFFSKIFGVKVFVVRIKKYSRLKKNEFLTQETNLNFVDGYPIHIINMASVNDLSKSSNVTLSLSQFRPNIVISGIAAYQEDRIKSITIAGHRLAHIKRCARCIMINLPSGDNKFLKEPLRSLSKSRKENNNVYFGIYVYYQNKDETIYLSEGDAWLELED